MRILFTTIQGAGHLGPLIPIARAAADAGHEVAVACAASFARYPERAGLRTFPAGFDHRGRPLGALFPGVATRPPYTAGRWIVPNIHAGVNATAMAPDLLAIAREWSPDLFVRDANEYAACVVAEVLGVPHAVVRTGSTTSRYGQRELVAAPLARLRELNGLPPDPEVAMPFRYLYLAAEPPGFDPPDEPVAPTAHRIRPQVGDQTGDEALPAWFADLDDRPTIYATLGTEASRIPAGQALFAALLAALRDEPYNVILTVGRDNDPARFGPQPPHIRIERYIPQSLVLPRCDLVLGQAGFPAIAGTLAAGLPLVVLPLMADQPYNAECVARLGASIMLGPDGRSPEAIRDAVRAVLADPTYRRTAKRVRDEMAALPGPEYAVALLERLVAEQRPLSVA